MTTISGQNERHEHTPGPWKQLPGTYDLSRSLKVCGSSEESAYFMICGGSNDERHANASLIAAAPEMYEILKSLAAPGINHGKSREILAKIHGRG